MTIKLVLAYRAPNPSNKRQHWKARMKEKHRAQDALLSALYSAASVSLMQTPSGEASRICWMAWQKLALYVATGRMKSVSKSSK